MSLDRRARVLDWWADTSWGSAAAETPAFSPLDIPNLIVWGNPDVGTFQTSGGAAAVSDADPVGELQDQSGNARHFGQVTASKRPTLKLATQNGKNTLLYDSGDDCMSTASVAHGIGTGDFFFVVACKIGASAANKTVFAVGNFAPAFYIDSLKMDIFIGVSEFTFDTALTAGSFYILEFKRESGTLKACVNGVQEASTFSASTNIATGVLRLGSSDGAAELYNSNIGQVALYSGTPSAGNRTSLINYLGAYYGVAVTP